MAILGFMIIFGWLVYKFFTKWMWWYIGLMILFAIINWLTTYGWIIWMIICFTISLGCFVLLFAHFREMHRGK